MERVVFLDRDGTLNEEVCYLYRPEDLHILPGVGEALRMLKEAGYRLVVVTNQAGVARGYYTEEDVRRLHLHMNRLLERDGAGNWRHSFREAFLPLRLPGIYPSPLHFPMM